MERPPSMRWYFVALLLFALMALAGHEAGAWRSAPPNQSSPVRIAIDPGGFIETLLPARTDPDNGRWVKRNPDPGGHNADVAVLGALAGVFVLGCATRSGRPCGTPLIRPVGRGAVVRGPPSLLTA